MKPDHTYVIGQLVTVLIVLKLALHKVLLETTLVAQRSVTVLVSLYVSLKAHRGGRGSHTRVGHSMECTY